MIAVSRSSWLLL